MKAEELKAKELKILIQKYFDKFIDINLVKIYKTLLKNNDGNYHLTNLNELSSKINVDKLKIIKNLDLLVAEGLAIRTKYGYKLKDLN